MSAPNHEHHPAIKLPLSLSIIFGSFTLGFYVAIQGPTLMDLIDLLHVNNDIMSHSMAFASLAYSFGGLLSGFLFNYVDRQILIPGYYVVFGVSNILTPYITNYYVFSVVTVFKMMCAGGTDCGANVWILDMWPGKDAWLQALHFSFAVGCALGPLVVEPFLSANEHSGGSDASLHWDGKGSALINNESTESRIYIPYGVSGSASLLAAGLIVYFYYLEDRKRRADRLAAIQAVPLVATTVQSGKPATAASCCAVAIPTAAGGQPAVVPAAHAHRMSITNEPSANNLNQAATPLNTTTSKPTPTAIEATAATTPTTTNTTSTTNLNTTNETETQPTSETETSPSSNAAGLGAGKQSALQLLAIERPNSQNSTITKPTSNANITTTTTSNNPDKPDISSQLLAANNNNQLQLQRTSSTTVTTPAPNQSSVKFTSKCRDDQATGRPPYYVMFAIALAAMCLSFYCGIEITSMNYLATFAVNIDGLNIPKSTAALMSSALTISFAVGRLFGIWIAAHMRPHKLFYLCSCVMALGNFFILIFANAEPFLWASICLFGIGCGPMYASIVSFYDDKIAKVTNTVSGIFILGSMFNVALNTVIIGHYIIDNALILIVCNLIGAVLLLCLFGSLHALTRIKKNQRKRKFKLQQLRLVDSVKLQKEAAAEAAAAAAAAAVAAIEGPPSGFTAEAAESAEQQVALLDRAAEAEAQAKSIQQQQTQTPTTMGIPQRRRSSQELATSTPEKRPEQQQQQQVAVNIPLETPS